MLQDDFRDDVARGIVDAPRQSGVGDSCRQVRIRVFTVEANVVHRQMVETEMASQEWFLTAELGFGCRCWCWRIDRQTDRRLKWICSVSAFRLTSPGTARREQSTTSH
jgi:hypothetical protein